MEKAQTFLQSLERLWQLCVFQSSPQELKVGRVLAAVLIPFYLLAIFVTLIITPGLKLSMIVGTSLVAAILTLVTLFLWGLHWYKGTRKDFLPSILSIIGTQNIILFINMPALLFYNQISHNNIAGEMVLALMLVLLGWSLVITGRILHFSLQISHALGGAIAISLVFVIRAAGLMVLS